MRKSVILMTTAALVLTSCGTIRESRVNPFNWFGRSESVPVEQTAAAQTNPLIPAGKRRGLFSKREKEDLSVPVRQITDLRVERTNAGAIIYATALADRTGAFGAVLLPDPADPENPSVLSFTFRVTYPEHNTPAGTPRTRSIIAAHSVSRQDLAPIRTIRVNGAANLRETRRR